MITGIVALIYLGFYDAQEQRMLRECGNELIFTHYPTDTDAIEAVIPPPSLIQGHLKTHGYFDTRLKRVPVYAPADSVLTSGIFYSELTEEGEYMLDFDTDCGYSYRFDHVTEPLQIIIDQLNQIASKTSHTVPAEQSIEFQAGDLIGYTTGTIYGIWDFGVYLDDHENQFVDNEDWNNSTVYTTAVCPFDVFDDEKRDFFYSKFTEFEKDNFDEFCVMN